MNKYRDAFIESIVINIYLGDAINNADVSSRENMD